VFQQYTSSIENLPTNFSMHVFQIFIIFEAIKIPKDIEIHYLSLLSWIGASTIHFWGESFEGTFFCFLSWHFINSSAVLKCLKGNMFQTK